MATSGSNSGNLQMTYQQPGSRDQQPESQDQQQQVLYEMDYVTHADKRVEIEKDDKLRLHLQDWEDEKKQQVLSVESYRGRCNAAKTELYQLMGFYSVFQGVVFTAVAQASKLACQTSLCPALLSLLASIATAISVHYKLSYYETQKLKLIKAQLIEQNIRNKIELLKATGKKFDFAKSHAQNSKRESDKTKYVDKNIHAEEKSHGRFYGAVMIFLAVFTLTIMASCVIVLCWDQEKHRVRPCASTLCWRM